MPKKAVYLRFERISRKKLGGYCVCQKKVVTLQSVCVRIYTGELHYQNCSKLSKIIF